jgi:hypothetical protein
MARHRRLIRMRPALVLALLLAVAGPIGTAAADSRTDRESAALAAERYYSSYGVPPTNPARATASAPDGFHWDDAALGAGAALGLALVLSGGVALHRRDRSQHIATHGAG